MRWRLVPSAPIVAAASLVVAAVLGACDVHDASRSGFLVPKTVTEDPSLPRYVLADGTVLHLQTFGDPSSPPLLVLHGGPGGDYRGYLSLVALADTYFVVFFDQRGAGLSERVPESQLDGPRYLADLEELADHFAPNGPFFLLGHSWGGAYATYYVQHHPDRVARLVLVEPGALTPEAARVANRASLEIADADLNRYLLATSYLLPDSYAEQDYFFAILTEDTGGLDDFANAYEKEHVLFWRNGYLANHGINTWQGNFGTPTFDATIGLDAFAGPTLLLGGTASKRLGYDFQVRYHAPHFRDVTVTPIEGAGHYSLQYDADVVIPLIRDFLASPSPSGGP